MRAREGGDIRLEIILIPKVSNQTLSGIKTLGILLNLKCPNYSTNNLIYIITNFVNNY